LNPIGTPLLYVFLGDRLRITRRCDLSRNSFQSAKISNSFPGLPEDWTRFDAVVFGPPSTQELIIFRGSLLVRFSLEAHACFSGYPRTIAKEFNGTEQVCPACAERVSAALYDPSSELIQLWCGFGDVYCTAKYRWGWPISQNDWVLRPSQDFGSPLVRAAFGSSSVNMHTVLLAGNFSQCEVQNSETSCSDTPLPYFGQPELKKCQRFAFCSACTGSEEYATVGECTECEDGFMMQAKRCVPIQSRVWADFAIIAGSDWQEDVHRSGARTRAELNTWNFVQGPFNASFGATGVIRTR
jgi:hypothetical protein